MLHISLFSGIGGFDLASEWMGWTNIASCEINPFGRKVLEYYWPNAYHHDDIKTLTYKKLNEELTKKHGANWRADDIVLTGGFPCQPYSLAGKRLGTEDERHLWPEMLRVIREVSPKWIVGENVFGLVNWSDGLVFHEVQTDLEALGYEVQSYVLPACGVNAPHRRDRIFIIAKNPMFSRCIHRESKEKRTKDGKQRYVSSRNTNGICREKMAWPTTNANNTRNTSPRCSNNGNGSEVSEKRQHPLDEPCGHSNKRTTTHTNNTGGGGRLGKVQGTNGEVPERHYDAEFGNASNDGTTTDTERIGHPRRTETSGNDNAERIGRMDEDGGRNGDEIRGEVKRCSTDTGNSDAMHTNGTIEQGEHIGQTRQGKSYRPNNGIRVNNWDNFPTQSPICSRNDGISARLDGITFPKWRNESIKAGGNAVVPPLIYNIFKTIQQYEDDTRNHI